MSVLTVLKSFVSPSEYICKCTCDGLCRGHRLSTLYRPAQADASMLTGAGGTRQKKPKYSSSSAFFGQLQDQRDAVGKSGPAKAKPAPGPSSKALKL